MDKIMGYVTRSYFAGPMLLVIFELGNGEYYPAAVFIVGLTLSTYVIWGGE